MFSFTPSLTLPTPPPVSRSLISHRLAVSREYLEVATVIAAITLVAWFTPLDYRVFGDIYLAAVIALSLRVGRWPILFATVFSVLAWNFAIVPPRLSFSQLDLKDGVFLGTYFFTALLAGQLTSRLRAQERRERQREQRATALFHLSRALNAAETLDEGVATALRLADTLFECRSSLLLSGETPALAVHAASSLSLTRDDLAAAEQVYRSTVPRGRPAASKPSLASLHVPLHHRGHTLGVLTLGGWRRPVSLAAEDRELLETFAAQISLHVERERLRAVSEHEKLLAESDRLQRTLLDSVSHELKTPLAVLRTAAENLTTDDPSRRQSLAAEVRTATARLTRVVGNLLNQSRLEAGGLIAKLDWCDVRDVIVAARRDVGDALAPHPITIAIAEDTPLCQADFALLEQVVANLLVNAALHTPPGTPVSISAGVDRIAERFFLTVADRGPGLPAELRDEAFHKFRRGAGARPGGLGLGLSIVHGFMRAQGGSVQVSSQPGGGACFTLHLPYLTHDHVPHE